MPGEARGSKCKGTKVSNFLRGRLWGPSPALRHWLFPNTYLNVYMFVCLYVFICSYVSKTATNIGYWTLMANTSLHHDTESKNFDNKDQLPSTSTTGSKPSLTSYYWTQSLRHFWGGSINNISELDQFIIRAINRGPFHSTVAKAWKLVPTYFSPGWHKVREPGNRVPR